jgi:ADP-ribose pyrophosphatase YjhB (NUDIX family)
MWKLLSDIASFKSPWLELIGEKWESEDGQLQEYWRIVSADSVIIIPEQSGEFLLPLKMFRPGVGVETLDFPGGRMALGEQPENAAVDILWRELGVAEHMIDTLTYIYDDPKMVNSSTSSQKLFGVHALLNDEMEDLVAHHRYKTDAAGTHNLLKELECLQCRALLLEFLRIKDIKG